LTSSRSLPMGRSRGIEPSDEPVTESSGAEL
jgi:hypothetical protein